MVDLEGLANHRGSLLGEMPGGQPSQKAFESALAGVLCALDPTRPVVVEAESSKVGERILPPSLWSSLCVAPRIELSAPIEARAAYLVRAYDDILSDGDRLRDRLNPLRFHRGHDVVDTWFGLIEAEDKQGLTRLLMEQHYDPAYTRSRRARAAEPLARVTAQSLDSAGLDHAVAQIERILSQL